jgi:hypothetical protein
LKELHKVLERSSLFSSGSVFIFSGILLKIVFGSGVGIAVIDDRPFFTTFFSELLVSAFSSGIMNSSLNLFGCSQDDVFIKTENESSKQNNFHVPSVFY